MSNAIIAYGGKMERSIDATIDENTTWVEIPEATGLGVPSVTTEYIDVTNLQSPGGFREQIAGLKDGGEFALECNYTADGFEQQEADRILDKAIHYRATLPIQSGFTTADVFVFQGLPTAQLTTTPAGEVMKMTINIRVTGEVTYTKGTPE